MEHIFPFQCCPSNRELDHFWCGAHPLFQVMTSRRLPMLMLKLMHRHIVSHALPPLQRDTGLQWKKVSTFEWNDDAEHVFASGMTMLSEPRLCKPNWNKL